MKNILSIIIVFHLVGWVIFTNFFSWEFQNKNSWITSTIFSDHVGFIKGAIWEYYVIDKYIINKENAYKSISNKTPTNDEGKVLIRLQYHNGEMDIVDRGELISLELYSFKNKLLSASFDLNKNGIIDSCKTTEKKECSKTLLRFYEEEYAKFLQARKATLQ